MNDKGMVKTNNLEIEIVIIGGGGTGLAAALSAAEKGCKIWLSWKKRAHLMGEPMISVNGNRAEGHWRVYIFCSKPSVQWVQGRNDCEYVKEHGQWKISKLKFTRTLASDPSLFP